MMDVSVIIFVSHFFFSSLPRFRRWEIPAPAASAVMKLPAEAIGFLTWSSRSSVSSKSLFALTRDFLKSLNAKKAWKPMATRNIARIMTIARRTICVVSIGQIPDADNLLYFRFFVNPLDCPCAILLPAAAVWGQNQATDSLKVNGLT